MARVTAEDADLLEDIRTDVDIRVLVVCRLQAQSAIIVEYPLERGLAVVEHRANTAVGDVIIHQQHVIPILDSRADHRVSRHADREDAVQSREERLQRYRAEIGLHGFLQFTCRNNSANRDAGLLLLPSDQVITVLIPPQVSLTI